VCVRHFGDPAAARVVVGGEGEGEGVGAPHNVRPCGGGGGVKGCDTKCPVVNESPVTSKLHHFFSLLENSAGKIYA